MPIQVTCPSCHARFNVSDKFAGQSGPCPKCKVPIKIPAKSEEVVVHAPEQFGPKGVEGKAVLKPIEREEVKLSLVAIVGIVAACITTLVVAFVLGRAFETVPNWLLGIGAFLLAPPLVYAGYTFLRNDELQPYRGASLSIRVFICAVVYALLWAVYWGAKTYLLGDQVEPFHLVFVAPVLLAGGATAALACLDFDFGTGALHYGMYLLVTVLMRVLMGMSAY